MIAVQWLIAAVPWIHHNNYTIFVITCVGSVLAIASAGLPQWEAEKWSAARVNASDDPDACRKEVLIPRGNGHQYAMVVRCQAGAWDLETMATGRPVYCQGTRWCLWLLAAFWITLFFTALGIEDDTWYLVGVGLLGMLQNTLLAACPCSPEELEIVLTPHHVCSSIVGYQRMPTAKANITSRALTKAETSKRSSRIPASEMLWGLSWS